MKSLWVGVLFPLLMIVIALCGGIFLCAVVLPVMLVLGIPLLLLGILMCLLISFTDWVEKC